MCAHWTSREKSGARALEDIPLNKNGEFRIVISEGRSSTYVTAFPRIR